MINMKTCFKSRSSGFTLIEILIVVAILGILVAIALPTYQTSVLRTHRTEAKSTLLQTVSFQESFYSANNTYSTNANPLSNPVQASVTSENGYFVVTVATCVGGAITNCFLATATAQGKQTDDSCVNLTIDSFGNRGSSAGVAADCWKR